METHDLTPRQRNAKKRKGALLDDSYHDREDNWYDDADKDFEQEEDDANKDFEQ